MFLPLLPLPLTLTDISNQFQHSFQLQSQSICHINPECDLYMLKKEGRFSHKISSDKQWWLRTYVSEFPRDPITWALLLSN